MVASGDADALNLRHIRRRRGHLFLVAVRCSGAEDERAVTRPNRRRPLSSKRMFNQVPAKTALVLTGSAIALAGYLGASANDAGRDGRAVRPAGPATARTASHLAQATGPINAGTSGLGTGLKSSGLQAGLESGGTGGISGAGGPAPIALAAYGIPDKHPQAPLRYAKHHQRFHPRRHPKLQEKHRAVQRHRATTHPARSHPARSHPARSHPARSRTPARGHLGRGHLGRLHGNPWQIAGSLMPAYHWTSWQFHYLNLLWMRESGWNRFAYNHSSGAYGIPQAVPGDKMAAAGPDWRTSARTQIIWGMGYIQSRYGNPWNAWQHELRYGWY